MELNYGYKLRLANLAERAYGKRSGDLSVVVPGRTMRIEYAVTVPAFHLTGNPDDDDEEANEEREFKATSTVYWNYVKEPTKFITVKAQRENTGKGKATTSIELLNTPHFDLLRFAVDKVSNFLNEM